MGKEDEDNETEVTQEVINEWVERILQSHDNEVAAIIQKAQTLEKAKEAVKHGNWEKLFKDKGGPIPFTCSTAERYLDIAKNKVLTNPANSRVLPPRWTTLAELATLDDHILIEAIKNEVIHPDMRGKDVRKLKEVELKDAPKHGDALRRILSEAVSKGMDMKELANRILERCEPTTASMLRDENSLRDLFITGGLYRELIVSYFEISDEQRCRADPEYASRREDGTFPSPRDRLEREESNYKKKREKKLAARNSQSSEKQAIERKRLKDDGEREATVH